MRVLRKISELAQIHGPVVVAAGVFDGIHPGHQAVLRAALDAAHASGATPLVLTFDPHPSKVLRPHAPSRLLTSTAHKLRLLEEFGIEAVLIVPFTPEFAALPAESFIRQLASGSTGVPPVNAPPTPPTKLQRLCVGHGWQFGHAREGNPDLLRRLGAELGFTTTEVAPVEIGGQMVSSTRIRQAVEAGNLTEAELLLGRPYAILGTVIRGEGLGRQLGFPTANLSAHSEQFPPNGVYAVKVRIPGDDAPRPGIANIGIRPTVHSHGERLLEVHLPNFSRDIYGLDLEITFQRFLRPEKKFPSLDALRAQIAADIEQDHISVRNPRSGSLGTGFFGEGGFLGC